MPKNINLVTGAMGFSASYVVRALLNKGERVIGTDLPQALDNPRRQRVLENIGLDLNHPNLTLIPADLLEPNTLPPLFKKPIRTVFHAASLYDYSAPYKRLRRINVTGTRNLLEVAIKAKPKRFVHWSTCGVFGKPYTAAVGRKVNIPFDENSPSPKNSPFGARGPRGTHIVNAYSASKWEQEQFVWQAYRKRKLPVTVVRPAPIYGPGGSYGHGGLIIVIAQGKLPAIPCDAKNYITTTVHAEDMARFAIFIADRADAVGEDYNVVDNSIISYREFLHYVALLCGRKMRNYPLITQPIFRSIAISAAKANMWIERNLGRPHARMLEPQSATYLASSYWLSNRKSLATGFRYRYPDVREGLKDTIAWFRDAGWLTK